MSASTEDVFPSSLALLGGIPIKSQDFAISIALALVYVVLVLGAFFRVAVRSSRCWALLRPVVFINIRVPTFGIRAIQANGHYSQGLFIAEQVLLLCGFVLLCEPLVDILGYHITRYRVPTAARTGTKNVLLLLKITLYVALALGGYAGTQFGKVNKDSGTLHTVKTLRDINAIICMVITALAAVVVVIYHFREDLPTLHTAYILVIAVILTIPSVYKLVLYVHQPPPDPIKAGTKFSFYLLNALPELIVCILLLSINLNTTFDIDGAARKEKASQEMMAPIAVYPISNGGGFRGPAPPGDYAMVSQRPLPDETRNPLLAEPHPVPGQGSYTGYVPPYRQGNV